MSFAGPRPLDGSRQTFSYSLNAPQAFAATRAQAATLPVLEEARKRLLFVGLGLLTCFLLIAGRLFDVMILDADAERGSAPSNNLAPASISRADIVDRNGELLATSLQMASLAVDPAYVMDEKETLQKLKALFPDLDTAALSRDMHSGKRFVWIKHDLTPRQAQAVNAMGLPGLTFQSEERRIYPKGALTAHVVGFNSIDQEGLAGIERSFNKQLTSSEENLPLSIDIRLQGIMHDALSDSMRAFNAIGGAGLVMDVETGELLAMVSLPDFDPNNAGQASESARFNRATLGTYEMGSTFKIFTISQALEKGVISLTDKFNCMHPLKIGGKFEVHDFHPEGRWLNVPEILVYSSNIGAAQIIERVRAEDQKKYLGSLGLLTPSSVELSEMSRPLVPRDWRDINKIT
ncbi:MAG TPA: penicillin-binding protein 2, partial [Alphaproteobacteria bacterium]|nr:penicillin-binding protein 2 [Alphaproteobacteria bacterium]